MILVLSMLREQIYEFPKFLISNNSNKGTEERPQWDDRRIPQHWELLLPNGVTCQSEGFCDKEPRAGWKLQITGGVPA